MNFILFKKIIAHINFYLVLIRVGIDLVGIGLVGIDSDGN